MFTGISGSYPPAIAAMLSSSVGFARDSPSGVHAVWGVTSFTARLLAPFQCCDQCVPGQRRALHPRRIFVNAGQWLQPLQWFGERCVAMLAGAGARHLTERVEQ